MSNASLLYERIYFLCVALPMEHALPGQGVRACPACAFPIDRRRGHQSEARLGVPT